MNCTMLVYMYAVIGFHILLDVASGLGKKLKRRNKGIGSVFYISGIAINKMCNSAFTTIKLVYHYGLDIQYV